MTGSTLHGSATSPDAMTSAASFSNGGTAITADVVVIGAGPAGIAAASSAAERGLRVVLIDRARDPGGQIWRHARGDVGAPGASSLQRRWLARLADSGARLLMETSVIDACVTPSRIEMLAHNSGRAIQLHAANVILATGARELYIPFPGWTLPGVVGIGGAQALLKSGVSFVGKRVAIAGSGPLILPVAAALAVAGARLVLVAEQAPRAAVARLVAGLYRSPATLLQAARYRATFASASYSTGIWVTEAHGDGRIDGVSVTNGRRSWRVGADVLCTGYGLVPNIQLATLLGCDVTDGSVAVDARQQTSVERIFAIGEATGIGGAPMSLAEGEIAGLTVANGAAPITRLLRHRRVLASSARRMAEAFALRSELRRLPQHNTIVCRCEDVEYAAVSGAASVRQAKLRTRVGMGPCQGRTCMPALEFLFGWQPDTVRPPAEPVPVSVLSAANIQVGRASLL